MNPLKKTTLVLLVLSVIGGGGYLIDTLLGKPRDPSAVVQTALTDALESPAKHTETQLQITSAADNSQLEISWQGSMDDTAQLLPTADYQLSAAGTLPIENQLTEISGHLDFRIVDGDIYFQIKNPLLRGTSPKITAIQNYLTSLNGKWIALPLTRLTAEDTTIAQVMTEKNTAQQNLRTKIQNLLSNKNIFTIKKATGNLLTGQYEITVAPELKKILSADLISDLAKILGINSEAAINKLGEDLLEAKPEITLTIARSDYQLLGYSTTLRIGDNILVLKNTVKKLKTLATITAPETSEVFDATAWEKAFGATKKVANPMK